MNMWPQYKLHVLGQPSDNLFVMETCIKILFDLLSGTAFYLIFYDFYQLILRSEQG